MPYYRFSRWEEGSVDYEVEADNIDEALSRLSTGDHDHVRRDGGSVSVHYVDVLCEDSDGAQEWLSPNTWIDGDHMQPLATDEPTRENAP